MDGIRNILEKRLG